MSIKVMSEVWEIEGIDSSECLVLIALADHADDQGRCYPSINRLASRTKLSGRGVQKVISRLIEKGFVTVTPCAGQGGANLYTVTSTPEPRSPLNDVHPRTTFATPLNHVRETPEPRSPKPSRTIIEPSDVIPQASPVGILSTVVSPRMAQSFVALRSKMKKPVNDIAAERLAKSLQKIADQGGDPEDALGLCQEKGWQSIKPEWYFKDIRNEQSSRSQPRAAAQSDAFRDLINDAAAMRRTSGADWR